MIDASLPLGPVLNCFLEYLAGEQCGRYEYIRDGSDHVILHDDRCRTFHVLVHDSCLLVRREMWRLGTGGQGTFNISDPDCFSGGLSKLNEFYE